MTVWLASVALLAFVMAATPGPNNLIFAASGARSGYVRTLPMLAGMIVGFVVLIGATTIGVAGVFGAVPGSLAILTGAASVYMAWLGFRLWRASTIPPDPDRAESGLMAWWQMSLFQVANPKTWLAALAFVTGKLGPNAPGGRASDVLGSAVFLLVVWTAASMWSLFGSTLRTKLKPAQWQQAMRAMAVLAILTIPTFWW